MMVSRYLSVEGLMRKGGISLFNNNNNNTTNNNNNNNAKEGRG